MAAWRERPADGGIVWHEAFHAFECYGCTEFEEIRKASDRTPDRLAELREMLIIEHTECWLYNDVEQARKARRYRKESTRRKNLQSRAGQSLDRMSVSWRGRR
jgi:hypothetical protein